MVSNRSLRGQAKVGALVASMAALVLSVLFLSGPSLGEDKSLLNTQTGDKFGLDSPKELDARFGGSGTPSQKSENEEIKGYVRGQADSRARNYVLRLISDNLQEAGRARWGQNFSLQSSFNWQKGSPIRGSVSAVIPLVENQANWGSFLQPGFRQWTDDLQQNRNDVSLGYVARRRIENLGTVGGSVFLDRSTDYGHQRASLGAEWRGGPTFLSATLHQPLTGPRRGPDGRYERVLGGWNAKLRRSIGDRLSVNLSASEWRDPGDLDAGKTIGGISLGESQSVGLSFQAHPAVRLYGDYARSRTPSSEASDSWKLGFEYRLTGERQRLRQASKEGEGGIFDPIRERPALSVGIVALAALILTDESGGGGGGGGATATCPETPSACPQTATAATTIKDIFGTPLSQGGISRDTGTVRISVKLSSVPSATIYRAEFTGTAVPGTEYNVIGLYVQQGDGEPVPQTNPSDHFRVPAGGETTLEAAIQLVGVASADASEIVMHLVPVKASEVGSTTALSSIEIDEATGVITVRIPLAAVGTGVVGEKAVLTKVWAHRRVQRDGTPIDSSADSGLGAITNTASGSVLALEGDGESATDSDKVTVGLKFTAQYHGLGDDNKPGGTGNSRDPLESFPEGTQPIKAYVRLEHSEGASKDSYELVIDTATNEQSDAEISGSLREISSGFWEVPMARVDSSGTDIYAVALNLTAKNVRSDGQKVKVTVELAPVEIKTGETITRVPTYPFADQADVDITLNSNYVVAEQAATIAFGGTIEAGASVPGVAQAEPTATTEDEEQTSVDVNIPIEITYPTARPAGQTVTIPLVLAENLLTDAKLGEDFRIDQPTQELTTATSDGNPSTEHTVNFVVQVLSDAKAESRQEYFEVRFGEFSAEDNIVVAEPSRLGVSINDTPPAGEKYIHFTSATLAEVDEPASGTADATLTLMVTDLGTSTGDSIDVKVRLADSPNGATLGSDANSGDYYVEPNQAGVTLTGNILTVTIQGDATDENSGTPDYSDDKVVMLKINSDDLAEGRENITATVLPSDDGEYHVDFSSIRNAIAPINDADNPFFRLAVQDDDDSDYTLKEDRDDGKPNRIRISAHKGNGPNAALIDLERPLTFFINADSADNDFDNNDDRVGAESFDRTVTIPAGESHAYFPVRIGSDDAINGANNKFSLNRIVANSRGVLPGLLEERNHRGLGNDGVKNGTTDILIFDDDRAQLQLFDRDESGAQGQLLNADGANIEIKLPEDGSKTFFLTIDKNFNGAGVNNADKGRVTISVTGLGSGNNNNVSLKAYATDGTTAVNDLGGNAFEISADGSKNTTIPLTNLATDGARKETDRLVLALEAPNEDFGDAQDPINIGVKFHQNANVLNFNKDVDKRISQDVAYVSNDLSVAMREESLSLTEGQEVTVTAILVREGQQVSSDQASDAAIPFVVFWADGDAASGTVPHTTLAALEAMKTALVANPVLNAATYGPLYTALTTGLGSDRQPSYPTNKAHFGWTLGEIPAGATEASVQLEVRGNKALDGLDNVEVHLVTEASTILVPTGRRAERKGLTIANAEGAEISWQDTNRRATGTEGTAETLNAKIRLIDPEGTVTTVAPDLTDTGDIEVVLETPAPITQGVDESDPVNSLAVAAGYDFDNDASTSGTGKTPKTLTFTGATGAATVAVTYDDDYITREDTQSRFNLVLRDVASTEVPDTINGREVRVDKTPLVQEWSNDTADEATPTLTFVDGKDADLIEATNDEGDPVADKQQGSLTLDLAIPAGKSLAESYLFYVPKPLITWVGRARNDDQQLDDIIAYEVAADGSTVQEGGTDKVDTRLSGNFLTFAVGTSPSNDRVRFKTGYKLNHKDGAFARLPQKVEPRATPDPAGSALTFTGLEVPSAGLTKNYSVKDADQNRVVLAFISTAQNWQSGAVVVNDDRDELYEDLAQKAPHKVRASLTQVLLTQDGDGNGGNVDIVITAPALMEVADATESGACSTSDGDYAATKTLSYTAETTEGDNDHTKVLFFCVRTKAAQTDGTADGFRVNEIRALATPRNDADGDPATDFSSDPVIAKFIVMDDDNIVSLDASSTLEVEEGELLDIPYSSDGVAAPSSEPTISSGGSVFYFVNYKMGESALFPKAVPGAREDYVSEAQDFFGITNPLTPSATNSEVLFGGNRGTGDDFINGDRYVVITHAEIDPDNRGIKARPKAANLASPTATEQTPVTVKITDNDLGKIAPSLTANTYPTGRVVALNGGSALSEGAEQNFHIVLDTAHRANATDSAGTAPLIIKLSPSSVPSGFTGADYEIDESASTDGVTVSYEASGAGGKGEATIAVQRQNSGAAASDVSVKSIPLKIDFTEDSITEGGGTVEWQITDLGYLGCDTLVEPATANGDTGCYRAGAVNGAPFTLAATLADETGDLRVTDTTGKAVSAITLDEGEDLAIRFTREPAGDLTPTVDGYAFDISSYVSVELPNSNAVTQADFSDYTAIDYDGNGAARPIEIDNFSLKGMTDPDGAVETETRAIELVMGRLGHASENSNSNTLIIGTEKDNLVEEDETFTLVIAKTPTPVQAQVGDKTVMISEETRITVTIKSSEVLMVEAYTQKAIVEGSTTPARTAVAGQYVLDFTKGPMLSKPQKMRVEFTSSGPNPKTQRGNREFNLNPADAIKAGVVTANRPGQGQVSLNATTTTGVTYRNEDGTNLLLTQGDVLTIPANVPVKVVFDINTRTILLDRDNNPISGSDYVSDGGKTTTRLQLFIDPNHYAFDRNKTFGAGFFLDRGLVDTPYRFAYPEVDDADVNSVSIEFGDLTPSASWQGGQAVLTSKKVSYESQSPTSTGASGNARHTAKVKLSRPWASSTALAVQVRSNVTGVEFSTDGGTNYGANGDVTFAQNDTEKTIHIRNAGAGGDGTAEGFVTTTITTTPTAASHSGLDTDTDSIRIIRMDDNNVMAMASATVTEGASTSITLASAGGAVTAPAGESYSVSATIADAAAPASASDSPLPLAGDVIIVPGQEATPFAEATGFTPSAAFTSNVISVKDDDYINGPRRINITQLEVSPDNRGVSFQDSSAQTAIATTIADDDVGSIFVSATPSRPTGTGHQTFLNGGAGLVEGQGYPFYLILSKPHRIGANTNRGGGVPLKLRLAGLNDPTGFNENDYAIQLARPTPGVTVDPGYGNVWGYGIEIDRQDTSDPNSPSVSVVPLLLVLKKDTDTETVNVPIRFGLQSTNGGALGWLGCDSVNDIVEPSGGAESGSHSGCYYIGSPDGTNRFEVVANLLDENQELNVSAVGDSDGDGVIEVNEGDDIAISLERLASTALTDTVGGYSWDISDYVSVKDLSPGLTINDFSTISIDYDGDSSTNNAVDITSSATLRGFNGATETAGINLILARTGHASAGSAKNTFIISTNDDDEVEGDESFTLVIAPTPRALDSSPVGGTPLKIGGTTREIKVIIKSAETARLTASTTTPITEAGPSGSPAHAAGVYTLNLSGSGTFSSEQSFPIAFTQRSGALAPQSLSLGQDDTSTFKVSLDTAASTDNVRIEGNNLVIPASDLASGITAQFNISLINTSTNDAVLTKVFAVVQDPNGLLTESPFAGEVGVVDYDKIRVILEFDELTGSWGGTENFYTSTDKKTLYELQGSTNEIRRGTLKLSRALDSGAADFHVSMTATNAATNAKVAQISTATGISFGTEVATDGNPLSFRFVQGQETEKIFYVRMSGSAGDTAKEGTAEGVTTITATPLAIDARSDSANFLNQTAEAKHVRFDNNNVFNVARGGFILSEGSELAVSLNNNAPTEGTGTAVTAPAGQKYTVKALGFSATTTLPVAIGGSDYLLVPEGVGVDSLDPATPITGLAEFPGDDFINGTRRVSLNGISVEPAKRGVNVGAARNFLVTIRDETPAASVAVHTTAAYPTLPAAAGVNNADLTSNLNNGNPVVEGSEQLFYLLLEKAHRANIYSSNRKPVQVRIAPLSGGLTRGDYEIKLGDPTQSGVEGGVEGVEVVASGANDPSGYIVRIDRKDTTEATSTSETIIPLLISLKKDDTTDAAATHTFGIVGHAATSTKALGPLTCGTSDLNWWQPTTLPTTKTYGSSHGCYQQAAIGQTPWRVALKFTAEPSVLAETTTEVIEGGGITSATYADGIYELTFSGGDFVAEQQVQISFTKHKDKGKEGAASEVLPLSSGTGTNANNTVKLITGTGGSTAGVSLSGSTLTLPTLPTGESEIVVKFAVSLGGKTDNDDGLTTIEVEMDKPNGLGAATGELEEKDGDDSKLVGEVSVKDADLNRVKVEFVSSGFDATPNWGYDADITGVSAVYHSADKQSIYEHQGTSNPNQTFRVVLDRPWESGTALPVVVGVGGAGSNLNIGTSSNPTTQTDISLSFAKGDTEKQFFIKSRLTQADEDAATTGDQNTASGFIETTITADPTVSDALAEFIADTNATADYFRMDNDNQFSIKAGTVEVQNVPSTTDGFTATTSTFNVYDATEGDASVDIVLADGAEVTAPDGNEYTVSFSTNPPAANPAPAANVYGAGDTATDFPASVRSVTATTLKADGTLTLPVGDSAGIINGDRYLALRITGIAPARRGASSDAIHNQTEQYVRIRDKDKANIALSNTDAIPDLAGLSGTNAEKAVIKLNDGVVDENDAAVAFTIALSKPHNARRNNAFFTAASDSQAPLQVKIEPITSPADFTAEDYTLALVGSPDSVIIREISGGKGAYIVSIDKKGTQGGSQVSQNLSLKTIPLSFKLTEDANVEGGGRVIFAITELGHLGCKDDSGALVLQPATEEAAQVGCYHPAAIGGEKLVLAVDLADEVTATAATTTEVIEGNASNTGATDGIYGITFAGGDFAAAESIEIAFSKQKDADAEAALTIGNAGSSAAVKLRAAGTGATDTTAGVSLSGSTLTLPAGTDPVKVFFDVGLGATGNDGGLTKVFMRVDKPKGLGAIGTGLAEDADDDSKLKGEVDVKDSDLNRITLEFEIPNPLPRFVGSAWSSGSPVYITQSAIYEGERYNRLFLANYLATIVAKLDRPWESSTPVAITVGVSGNMNIASGITTTPSAGSDITLTFNQNEQEKKFRILSTRTTTTSGIGHLTDTITATPPSDNAELAATTSSVKYIRMDDEHNDFSIKAGTVTEPAPYARSAVGDPLTKDFTFYDVVEGTAGGVPLLLADGVAVTAEGDNTYTVNFDTTATGDLPLPAAVAGEDYAASPSFETATLAPDGVVRFPLITDDDLGIINGNRFVPLRLTSIIPASRGASVEAVASQTAVSLRIKDNDKANIALSTTSNTYPSAAAGSTPTEKATVVLNSGEALGEDDATELDFWVVLTKAHKAASSAAAFKTAESAGGAPLKIKIEPVSPPADFTSADYEITLDGSPRNVTLTPITTGNGAYIVEVEKGTGAATSLTNIPLKLTIKEDSIVESGGTVNFEITALGHLGCSTLVEPAAAANAQTGCYHAGGVEGAKFKLALKLADEGGALNLSQVVGTGEPASAALPALVSGKYPITVAESDEGFGLTFTRAGDIASPRDNGYEVDLSTGKHIYISNPSSTLTNSDFGAIQIDYAGGGSNTLVNLADASIANVNGGVNSITGAKLKFYEKDGASDGSKINTLFFKINNDDLVETNETFDLVVDPETNNNGATIADLSVGGQEFKITKKSTLAVTITSEDAIEATWSATTPTATPITEGGVSGSNPTAAKGRYILTFNGAEFATATNVGIKFRKTISGGANAGTSFLTTGDSSRNVSLATGTTSGVTLSNSTGTHNNGTLNLPAGVSPIVAVFDIGLGQAARDGGTTSVEVELSEPTPADKFSPGTGFTQTDAATNTPYIGTVAVKDADQTSYEIKFEVDDTVATSALEDSATPREVTMFLRPLGGAALPPNDEDINTAATGNQFLVFTASLQEGSGTDRNAYLTTRDSTYNNGRYEWTLNLANDDVAGTASTFLNRAFTATVRTKTDGSGFTAPEGYKPITHEQVTGNFTLYEDSNTVNFKSNIGTADTISGNTRTAGNKYPAPSGEAATLNVTDYFELTAPAANNINYTLYFTATGYSEDGNNPLEARDYKVSTRNLDSDGNTIFLTDTIGTFNLATGGTLPTSIQFIDIIADEIIEEVEALRLTLDRIEPANRGLSLPSDISERSRVITFADSTANGVALLTLSPDAPEAADFTANTNDARTAAESTVSNIAEGQNVPIYVHLSKVSEKAQSFKLRRASGAALSEFSYEGAQPPAPATQSVSLAASSEGAQVASTTLAFAQDQTTEGVTALGLELRDVGSSNFKRKTHGTTEAAQNTITLNTATEAGLVTILDRTDGQGGRMDDDESFYNIDEGGGTLTLTLQRNGALGGANQTVIADVYFEYGAPPEGRQAATSPADYAQVVNNDASKVSVTFTQANAGDATQTATVDLPINPISGFDGVEADEFFTIKIKSIQRKTGSAGGTAPSSHIVKPNSGTPAPTNAAIVKIVDQDVGNFITLSSGVAGSPAAVTFSEGDANASLLLYVGSTRRANAIPVALTFTRVSGATQGGDYTLPPPANPNDPTDQLVVNIPASPSVSTPASLRVPLRLIDDTNPEPLETFTVALPTNLPTGFTQANPPQNSVTVTIADDDNVISFQEPPSESGLLARAITVTEDPDDTNTAFTLNLTNVAVADSNVTVSAVSLSDRTALNRLKVDNGDGTTTSLANLPLATLGADFSLDDNGVVAFAQGDKTADVGVTILDDELIEPIEYFALEITNAPSFGIGDTKYIIGRITDDDPLTLTVASPTAVIEDGAIRTGNVAYTTSQRRGTITLTMNSLEGLSRDYTVRLTAGGTNKFTLSPTSVTFRRSASPTLTRTVTVTARTGAEISPADATFTVSEASQTTGALVDIITGTSDTSNERSAIQRTFAMNYIDGDLFAPKITSARSSARATPGSALPSAEVSEDGTSLVLSESFIPESGIFIINLSSPGSNLAGSGDFATEIAKSGGTQGGQVNYKATILDGADTVEENCISEDCVNINQYTEGDPVTLKGSAGNIFSGVAQGKEAFGYWKNSNAFGQVGFKLSGTNIAITMPSDSYWRNNNTIEGKREFKVLLTPKGYVRDDKINSDPAATAADGANVASTTLTFIITDDDINTAAVPDNAQVSFEHFSFAPVTEGADDDFSDTLTTFPTGEWLSGLPSRVERGSRLWLRLSSTKPFAEHLTLASEEPSTQLVLAATPEGDSFLSARREIKMGFRIGSSGPYDNSKSEAFSVDVPFVETDSKRVSAADTRGHADLEFASGTELENKIPVYNAALQRRAVAFKQPTDNSVTQVEPSASAFNPVFTMSVTDPLDEDPAATIGKGYLDAGIPNDVFLGADSRATITFLASNIRVSGVELRVAQDTSTTLDSNKVSVSAVSGTPNSFIVEFKEGYGHADITAIPPDERPTFNLSFVNASGTRTDPDSGASASGTPIVTALVRVGSVETRLPITVLDNEDPAFGFVAQGEVTVFESDMERLFPQFSIGGNPIGSSPVTVGLQISVTAAATGMRSILSGGGWATTGTADANGRVPYTKTVTIPGGSNPTEGKFSLDNALFGLDLSNDATITAGGVYSLVFRGVDAAHVTTGNVPTSTSEPPDLTFTVYDDDREYSFLAGDRENTAQNGSSGLVGLGFGFG